MTFFRGRERGSYAGRKYVFDAQPSCLAEKGLPLTIKFLSSSAESARVTVRGANRVSVAMLLILGQAVCVCSLYRSQITHKTNACGEVSPSIFRAQLMALFDIFRHLLRAREGLCVPAQIVIHFFGVFGVDGLNHRRVNALRGVYPAMADHLTDNFYPHPRLQR